MNDATGPSAVDDHTPMLSVVTPCYNEQACLAELHHRVSEACRRVTDDYEIVLVDDGSTDGTWAKLCELGEADPHVVAVRLSRNHGHQLALTAGLSICRGQRVLILDADLQDPPELLAEMWARMDAGADVVYGQRRRREGDTVFKRATARVFYAAINWLSDTEIPPNTGDFRLISRRALDVLKDMPEQHRFIRGMVSWVGFTQQAVTYDRDPRFAGETKYPLRKMVRLASDAIASFSTKPLRLAGLLSFLTALVAVAVLVYVGISWLTGHTVSGWTSLMGGMALLSSVQLLVLALMGSYIGRMYEQAKNRPLFIVQDIRRAGRDPSGGAS